MFLALVMVMLFYIVLLYVLMFGYLCMYRQLLVLVIQPCCSSSLSYVHMLHLYMYLHIDEQMKNE